MQPNGVIMVFYDLPVVKKENLKSYRHFRKYLQEKGFMLLQESVYVKLVRSTKSIEYDIDNLKRNLPPEGTIMALPLTLPEFKRMMTLRGRPFDIKFFSDNIVSV